MADPDLGRCAIGDTVSPASRQFSSQEQRAEMISNLKVKIFVIDHIERPTPNN
jgi:hypothetical protein